MAAPIKTTSRAHSVRITAGSALERLTEGKPFTEAVHRMAELFEQALNENWGPPSAGSLVEYAVDPGAEQAFTITDQDGLTRRQVGVSEVLELAAEQYPSGLVPVGLDEGDGRDTAQDLVIQVEDEEDALAHLI